MKKTSLHEIETLIRDLGVVKGDALMIHADLRVFGLIEGNAKELISLLLSMVGDSGTIVTPSFTFTFPENFDLKKTATTTGALSHLFSREKNIKRLPDGMTSYYMIGRNADRLIDNWAHSSYGDNSIPHQIYEMSGKVLQLGTDILSLIHFLEERVGVPYREIMRFSGKIIDGDKSLDSYTDFYARVKRVRKIIPDPIRSSFYKTLKNSIPIENKELRLFDAKKFMDYSTPILKENNTILVKYEGD